MRSNGSLISRLGEFVVEVNVPRDARWKVCSGGLSKREAYLLLHRSASTHSMTELGPWTQRYRPREQVRSSRINTLVQVGPTNKCLAQKSVRAVEPAYPPEFCWGEDGCMLGYSWWTTLVNIPHSWSIPREAIYGASTLNGTRYIAVRLEKHSYWHVISA